MYPIAAIESAMIRRIHEARLPYLRFVGSYGGELLGDWKNVYPAVPAIWVTFAGATEAKALDTARTRFESVLTFTSIAAAYSPRTEGPRTGGPATAGAYAMLTDVARLTAMQDYALDGVDYLRPGRIRSLFSGQVQAGSLAVFAQYRPGCERPVSAPWAPMPAATCRPTASPCRARRMPGTIPGCRRWKDWPCATGANRRRTRPLIRPCWKTT